MVAISDPGDVDAQDTVRASIGRDFISVVASRDQIGDLLDRMFGPDEGDLGFGGLSADSPFTDQVGG